MHLQQEVQGHYGVKPAHCSQLYYLLPLQLIQLWEGYLPDAQAITD